LLLDEPRLEEGFRAEELEDFDGAARKELLDEREPPQEGVARLFDGRE
jgi:hypothetical protein